LRKDFPQEAVVHGSADRTSEKIPGEPDAVRRRGTVTEQQASRTVTPANFIRMRVLGMACFVGKRADTTEFENRIVFPYDTVGTGENKHFGFIEVAEEDTSSFTGDLTYRRYTRGGIPYRRWTLTEHRALLLNPDLSIPFSKSTDFTYHVPAMPEVCPELNGKLPRIECYKTTPNPQLFSGFVDIASGPADIADLEEGKTFFTRQIGGAAIAWTPRQTPRSVFVTQPFTGEKAIIVVETLSGSATAQIFVKPGSTIVVGNAREKDLTGDGSGDPTREAFLIYYGIAAPNEKPDNPALPAVYSAPVNACSVTRWP
jgi:hypothetical protein